MRIRLKFLMIILIVAAGFLAITLLNSRSREAITALQKIQLQSVDSLVAWKNMQRNLTSLYYSPRGVARSIQEFQESRNTLEKQIRTLGIQIRLQGYEEELQEITQQIQDSWDFYNKNLQNLNGNLQKLGATEAADYIAQEPLFPLIQRGREENWTGLRLLLDINRQILELDRILEGSIAVMEDLNTQLTETLEISQQQNRLFTNTISALLAVVAFVLSLVISERIIRRVKAMSLAIEKVAQRDLSHTYESTGKDEVARLGQFLNQIILSLNDFFQSVQKSSNEIHLESLEISSATEESAAAVEEITRNIETLNRNFKTITDTVQGTKDSITEISGSIEGLSRQTVNQKEAVENTSSAVEQMNASIQSVSKLTDKRQKGADLLIETVQKGGEQVEETFQSIREISQEIDSMLEVIEIINAVSQQTNILSMNAAIESAHAGEAGKGFAVVSEEIRNLAESTSEHAAVIDNALRMITEKIEQALERGQQSNQSFISIQEEVKAFSLALDEIGQNMRELSQGSQSILDTAHDSQKIIAQVTQEAQVIEGQTQNINQGMGRLVDITHQAGLGLREIEEGIREIHLSMAQVQEKNRESSNSIDQLNQTISSYQTITRKEEVSRETSTETGITQVPED